MDLGVSMGRLPERCLIFKHFSAMCRFIGPVVLYGLREGIPLRQYLCFIALSSIVESCIPVAAASEMQQGSGLSFVPLSSEVSPPFYLYPSLFPVSSWVSSSGLSDFELWYRRWLLGLDPFGSGYPYRTFDHGFSRSPGFVSSDWSRPSGSSTSLGLDGDITVSGSLQVVGSDDNGNGMIDPSEFSHYLLNNGSVDANISLNADLPLRLGIDIKGSELGSDIP